MKILSRLLLMALLLSAALSFQLRGQPQSQPQSNPPQRPDVVTVTTNLVQIDVTVIGRDGQPVNDLKADDFEVLEDSKPQNLTHFSFVQAPTGQPQPVTVNHPPKNKNAVKDPPLPPVNLRKDQVRRAIALVVDDLGLSFESSHRVRDALKRFVDEQMQPGDLVAIIRTGAGMGALQQFTGDKRMLYAAIDRVRYNLNSRSFNAFTPIGDEPRTEGLARGGLNGPPNGSGTTEMRGSDLVDSILKLNSPGAEATRYRDDIFSVGTLGAINFILRGLRELPGRKSIILFSDGFRLYDEDQGNRRILDSMNRLIDMANRASVVIHTIDARGVQTAGPTAADNLAGAFSLGHQDAVGFSNAEQTRWMDSITADYQRKTSDFVTTQQGLGFLSHQTGGIFIRNNNDVEGSVGKILNNEKGYYLLGYRPSESSFGADGKRTSFHHIDVRVKRPGLIVRTRAGFFGFSDEERRAPFYKNASEQLYAALASPFSSGDISVRMSSVFGYDPERSSFTESILHIDARGLTFNQQPDGTYKASFAIVTATFGDNGNVIDQAERAYSIVVEQKHLERTYQKGLIYIVTLPIKKAGAYQLRMAVRDATSTKVGTANQFIEVPDIKKKRLTLSGIILDVNSASAPSTAAASAAMPATVPAGTTAAPDSSAEADHVLINQAIRRFQHRQRMTYAYYVYNAKLDSSRLPRLETQIRLFRDGKLMYTGTSRPVDTSGQTDMRQIIGSGEILLGTDLPLGEYVLQVIVLDKLANSAVATQWMDFDLADPE